MSQSLYILKMEDSEGYAVLVNEVFTPADKSEIASYAKEYGLYAGEVYYSLLHYEIGEGETDSDNFIEEDDEFRKFIENNFFMGAFDEDAFEFKYGYLLNLMEDYEGTIDLDDYEV